MFRFFLVFLLTLGSSFAAAKDGIYLRRADRKYQKLAKPYRWPTVVSSLDKNLYSTKRFKVGKKLFYNELQKGHGNSCASCHSPYKRFDKRIKPEEKWAKYSIVGSGFKDEFLFKDSRFESLEYLVLHKVRKAEQGFNFSDDILTELNEAYPELNDIEQQVSYAIAVFLKRITPGATDFDNWLQGSTGVFKRGAKRGFKIFHDKGRCASCHSGWFFGGKVINTVNAKGINVVSVPSLRLTTTRSGKVVWDKSIAINTVLDSHLKNIPEKFDVTPTKLTSSEKKDLKEFIMSIRTLDLPPI